MEAGLPADMSANPQRLHRPDGTRPQTGIVHLGLGAFFRAHGAIYIEQAMEKSGGDWGIVGVSLMRPDQRDSLAPQDFAYTAVELGSNGETPHMIGVINDVLVARENPTAVIDAMSDPAVRIVSLTVTEKGYCHEPSTGKLNRNHPDIQHDLAHPEAPLSALGFLVRALEKRHAAGLRPFTVLCCDNLPENGKVVRGVVLELAGLISSDLQVWIASEGAFPSTMVDRIVPATKPEDINRLAQITGVLDLSPVMHEPFRQWVVEDHFVDGARPDLGKVGVELVEDVTPFEHMKLRCLNGTHSSLAYLGYLAGHETIAQTVADPVFARFCKMLWDAEITPGLKAPPGVSLGDYTQALFDRYANPAIRHRTWQIAMDGSQKLPQRILGTLTENLAANRPIKGLALAVAAWMRYVGGVDEKGDAIDVRDPLAARLKNLSDGAAEPADKVAALLAVREIFPQSLAENTTFRNALTTAYQSLAAKGSRQTVKDMSA
ncbi:mannitol dehydrogenase family protein [Agrobacterium vitis]|uniref:Mannitol dehydrogenase family protein n=1 Tax=Agrobacterium vitis TaxID=373 RepID=A0AAE4WE80_AGRVI|nr:mannitol dehydrogenase family protein [Agrobacterium vitis]MCF1497566.1 mannitol dehydrogenase family protein [Allorhizobium sp. Av2]MUZ59367.1 mannitol dehydrogenase family protein [Agrobacterium vitis]MVA67886.1 mannitol dehydrogenase family protein [Agrobacterium vitis]MVA89752.1 mannitol dehydrogenase family protein [Agrobacterium vitis]